MGVVLGLAEVRDGKLQDASFEVVAALNSLRSQGAGEPVMALLGSGISALADDLAAHGVEVAVGDSPHFTDYNRGAWMRAMAQIVSQRQPSVVVVSHSANAMDFVPSLAARLHLPIASNCVALTWQGGSLQAVRQMYGGRANATVEFTHHPPIVALQPGAVAAAKEKPGGGRVTEFSPDLKPEEFRTKHLGYARAEKGEVDIATAGIVIAVGRGLKEKENLRVGEDLAKALGGVLAGSRPLIDSGWLPHDRQVGVSGKTVKPKLYIALGISGQVQHISGMKGAELIVAINKDANAPIFKVAHYGIVGDLFKVVPAMMREMKG